MLATCSLVSNPEASVLSPRRREALLEIITRNDVVVLEDLTLAETLLDDIPVGAPLTADPRVRGIAVGSASKLLWGGLRVGWLRTAETWLRRIAQAKALEDDDISGIEVPDPDPFLANAALASTQGARTLVPRIKGESSGGTTADDGSGLRGTSLLSTEALPSGTTLASGQNSTIQASEQLKWRVSVENGGDVDLTNVVVKSSFSYPSNPTEPQEVEGAIESLPAGETGTVELAGPTDLSFGEQGTLSIEVVPVDGEGNTDNNSAEYPVTITI